MNSNSVDTAYKGIRGEANDIESRKHSTWMDLSYGMFVHLGLYSELGGMWKNEPVLAGYSEQIQMWAGISHEEYSQVAETFTLSKFDAAEIVSLAKDAGMTYLLITSKHHDGFCLFDTVTTDFNTVKATPFGQDVVKLLADECRKQGLQFGIYFSLVDWHIGHTFDYDNGNPIPDKMEAVIEQQLTELMTNYGEIVEVWFDMGNPTPEQSAKFSQIVQTHQPNAAINGRIWNNAGDFRTLDDNQVPDKKLEGAWQTPASIYNETWGYRKWQVRDNLDEKATQCLENLISVRARGGNYLLNIGPKGDGSLVPFEVDVLRKMGEWLRTHQAAIIKAQPTLFTKPEWGEITVNGSNLYLHIFDIPDNNTVTVSGLVSPINDVVLHESSQSLEWSITDNQVSITLPENSQEQITTVCVRLDSPLYVIPNQTIEETDNKWIITEESLDKGYNFTDHGNYTTLKESVVSLTGYFKQSQAKTVSVSLTGNASSQYSYQVSIGEETIVVDGGNLVDRDLGPFSIPSENCILPISIKLSNPSHRYQDLDLSVDKMTIEQID